MRVGGLHNLKVPRVVAHTLDCPEIAHAPTDARQRAQMDYMNRMRWAQAMQAARQRRQDRFAKRTELVTSSEQLGVSTQYLGPSLSSTWISVPSEAL